MMCSNSGLLIALSATVNAMVLLVMCSSMESQECGLQMTGKLKNRSVVFRNIDMKLCQLVCVEDYFAFASCRRLSDETIKSNVPAGFCESTMCSKTSECVETECEMVCLEAPRLCDLHNASKVGDFSRVNAILSQGRANIDCQEWFGRAPVMWAAMKGHREVVELLVNKGANVKLIDRFGTNILHSACLGGDVDVVKYVLSQDMVHIDGRTQCNRTPMMLAAQNGHKEVLELLVGEGADMSLLDKHRDNILHLACKRGHLEVVKYIVAQNKMDINSRGRKRMTPVMVSTENGEKDMVEFLVDHGADLSLVYGKGTSLLHLASLKGYLALVKYFVLQKKVDINLRGRLKNTPVMDATEMGKKDVVEFLVEHGADLSLKNEGGNNILHLACKRGHLEVVKYIVSQNKMDINSRGRKRMTPVIVSTENGEKDMVEFLVDHGADLSLVYGKGTSSLHLASLKGYLALVKYFVLQKKVDINLRGRLKNTPVMEATEMGKKDVVEFLVEHGADLSLKNEGGNNILHMACKRGHLEMVKYIVSQNKVDINRRGWEKMTPVMVAAWHGKKDIVEFLVEHGADLSLKNEGGNNILHLACKKGHLEVVKYIVAQNKVDINSRGLEMTPVMVATWHGKKDIVEFLVDHGADLSLVYGKGISSLHVASGKGYLALVKYFVLQKKVDINLRGRLKNTPVMGAAEMGKKDVVEFLVEHGADLSLKNKVGNNILHMTCKRGHLEMVKYIVSQNKVDINSRGWAKMTPEMFAARNGHTKVVEFLVRKGADV